MLVVVRFVVWSRSMFEAFRNAELGVSRTSRGPSPCAPRLTDGSEVDETGVQHTGVDVDRDQVLSLFR